ncbi:MAG: rRNA maturation RNase YbeY [Piscirickettsiaceae bacterium]|nr:rRNA maturation RNase YbeY [Piscirickettsiaceae bacterium]
MIVTVDLQIADDGKHPGVDQFQQWVDVALQEVSEDCELSIRLVDCDESAELNANYRGKDKPTNVLSFPFDSSVEIKPKLLGDLVICASVVEQEAKEQNKTAHDHWAHLVVHGCLHLLGYDHIDDEDAEIMESLEIKLLQSLNIDDPYQEQEAIK